jgi:23S rRNA (adenine2503-C2)-methyltransferase
MKIIGKAGREDIAVVYIAELGDGRLTEFVESVQPPIPREEKWVLIISTLLGCPVMCRICDAGGNYQGKLSRDEMLAQIDYLITRRFPDRRVPVEKFKVQFARIGEPAFNTDVLTVLKELPARYEAPGLMACISTIAPANAGGFFNDLLEVKKRFYDGRFQLQFSIHTTDPALRDWLVPVKKWDLSRIADYGEKFVTRKDRKIALNFALAEGMPIDAGALRSIFDPERFLVKMTPVNPTCAAQKNKIDSYIQPERSQYEIVDALRESGFEVLVSIGELEENRIGSNCGQYVSHYQKNKNAVAGAYSYQVIRS